MIYVYMYVCMCMYVCMYVCMYIYAQINKAFIRNTNTHGRTQSQTHTHTQKHTYADTRTSSHKHTSAIAHMQTVRTRMIKGTLQPRWNETFSMVLPEVYDIRYQQPRPSQHSSLCFGS